MNMRDKFPDLVHDEEEICMCGHSCKNHFSLGCIKCDCLGFGTWEEYDLEKEQEKNGIQTSESQ